MNLIHNTVINVFAIMILLVIGSHHIKNDEKDNLQYKLYFWLLVSNIVLLLVDIMGRFDGNPNTWFPVINHVGNFLLFLMNPIPSSLWLMYCYHQVVRDEKKTKRLGIPIIIANILNLVTVIIAQVKGYYYYIDSGNIYHRGELYLCSLLIPVGLLAVTIIMTLISRRGLTKMQFFALILFPISPIIGIIIQTKIYGISLQLTSTVIALLMIFLNIQNEQINTDYLTGLNNRKRLDDYFRRKISAFTEDKPFAAIMIDVDHFKAINDSFGHNTGDKVLQDVAKLLKASLGGKSFVARFGGDEFCLVLDDCDMTKLESISRLIRENVTEYNQSHNYPYRLGLSMGYSVYDNSHMSMEEFYHIVDQLMYQDKQSVKQSDSLPE